MRQAYCMFLTETNPDLKKAEGVVFYLSLCIAAKFWFFLTWLHMTVFVDSAFTCLGSGFFVIETVTLYHYLLAE